MRYRTASLLMLVMFTVGCAGGPGVDPFNRQTMIAPPGTGTYSRPGGGDKYYSAAPAETSSVLATSAPRREEPTRAVASNSSSTSPRWMAPGERNRLQVAEAQPRLRPVEFEKRTNSSSASPVRSVSYEEGIASARAAEKQSSTSRDYTDVATLPGGRSSSSSRSALDWSPNARSSSSPEVRTIAAAEPSRASRYGYDDNYRKLRGQLEYLAGNRQWKLRYIPIDGVTDDHGGSVVLDDGDALAQYQHGDYVEVSGQLGERPEKAHDYAPQFVMSSVRAVR